MIERTTGQIQLPSDGISIGPSLAREQFLASPLASQCRELVRNEPHCSFALPTVQFGDHSFAWSLWFHGSVLRASRFSALTPSLVRRGLIGQRSVSWRASDSTILCFSQCLVRIGVTSASRGARWILAMTRRVDSVVLESRMRANHALQRTRPSRSGCHPCVPRAGSLSLGR